jgi:PAS domain S-box-containing protein
MTGRSHHGKKAGPAAPERAAGASSDRGTAESAILHARNRAILESTTDGILMTDEQGKMTDFNAAFLALWRIGPDMAGAENHRRTMAACSPALAQPEAFLARLDEIGALAPPESFDTLEFADGRIVERASRLVRAGQRTIGRVWTFRDVTEHRRAQENLRQEREWFQVTLSSIGDGVITIDPSGCVTFLNPVATMMTGWRPAEALGQPVETVFHIVNASGRDRVANPARTALSEGRVTALADGTILIARHGAEIAIEDSAAPIKDATGRICGAVMVFYDVTERRRSEEAARLAAQRLQLAISAGNLGNWNWSAAGDRLLLGPRAEEMLGILPGSPVTSAGLEEAVHKDDRARVRLTLAQAIALRSDFRLDCRVHRPSGEVRWIAVRGRGAYTATGELREMGGVIQDITERKLSDADLLHSRTRLTMAMEAGQMGDWEWHVATQRVRWSPTLEAIHGLPPGGFGGCFEDFQSDIHPEDRERVLAKIQESVTGRSDYRIEYRIVKPDGAIAWIEARGKLFCDSQGNPERMTGICMDVTARKQSEEALRESEARFRKMADALREESTITEHLNELARALATELDPARIAQTVVEAGTRVTRAQCGVFYYYLEAENGAVLLCRATAGARDETEDLPCAIATPEQFESVMQDGGVVRREDVRADPRFDWEASFFGRVAGDGRLASCLAVPVSSRSGKRLGRLFFGHAEAGVFTGRDEKIILGIAAQTAAAMDTARLYRAEQQARGAAEQANRTKDEFLATLSHELRTPLTPVLMILSELAEATTLPEGLANDIRLMRRNVELEARLIDDLLDLTRIARGKMELHCERVSIAGLIENALSTCLPDLKAKQLSLRRELVEPPPLVVADGARIMQILWNLLKNAIKFTPEGGEIVVRSRFRPDGSGGQAVIEIQDTGRGIELDRLQLIFDAFEQGPREITRQFGGLGLGLAISRGIAEAHGGTIAVASEGPDRGCTFTLILPADGCDEARPPVTAGSLDRAETGHAPASRPPRILLVEDHADTAAVLVRMLRRTGYDVIHATTALVARETVEREEHGAGIDVVLSDLRLPDGSGLDLMRDLSTKHGLRGIALSGFGMDTDRAQSIAAGFSRHLTKPVNVTSVRTAIADVLAE